MAGFSEIPQNIKDLALQKAREQKETTIGNIDNSDIKGETNNPQKIDDRIEKINKDLEKEKFLVRSNLINNILKKEDDLSKPREQIRKQIITFLWFQLIFMAALISAMFISKGTYGSFNNDVFLQILDFLKFYISVIISEFIAMIFFIVKFLYNTKLVEILKEWFEKL